ncbi:hypothetical protein [Arcobacter sp. CECT 8985]|uniref:hypothetical protein n=1 Tax=Arcobacter sp. CECT 8985 TaxID=1935424 RepID=UPI00100BF1E0|nr:hypothetical protein [Arcobacter sp. CECT 8985]RXJ87097.1 hypothetical protein CRU93_05870 [Arcobacter sp. CECT 8985]
MVEIFEFFNQGWVGSLIGVIGIILGIVGIFSYRISKSIAKPSYQKSSFRLIGRDEDNLPKDVKVTYKGNEVDRLTKTTLTIWNNGTETLDGSDVVESDPLFISFKANDKILSYKILKKTKDANAFVLNNCDNATNKLRFKFEYLDPNDGVVIELLHDSEERYPEFSGTIKGLPSGFVDQGRVLQKKRNNLKDPLKVLLDRPKVVFVTALVFGLAMTVFGLLPQEARDFIVGFLSESSTQKSIEQQPIFFVVLGVLYTSMPAFMLWARRKKYPKQLDVTEIEP